MDEKSNNIIKDGKQHNLTLRQRNHKDKNLDLCENHLFKLKTKWWKRWGWVILSQKLTIEEKPLERKNKIVLLEKENLKND